ncbi:YdcF family protein [Clostridium sp. P21]|uniref:YdcF family protein n=1 Tax=Clostridium muellerianum TaxID=2716538 RepID=A0A7Y0HPY5_9CLOT|nr:YdcF family protein [Clostridium muellerianum]NMM64187.1 YdcF family protein [Clostridium muellerianum]
MIRFRKLVLYGIGIIAVLVIIFAFQVVYFGESSKPQKSDCIVILGCKVYGSTPSPFLAWRTDEGLKLFKEGYANYIIVSGGKGEGENISEAEAMKRYLVHKGVDASKVIIEDKSATTMANLINSKNIMEKRQFKTAIIVSNKYHLKRASLMAKDQGINASYSGVFVTPYKSNEIIGYIREVPALIKYYGLKVYSKMF